MDVSLKLVLYQAINFIILIAILGYLFNRFIRPLMKKRADDIKNSFVEIDRQKQAVEQLKKETADQLEKVKAGAKAEIDRAVAEGDRIKDDMFKEAKKEAEQFMDKARKEIEQEKGKAVSEVRKEVASLSMLAAQRILKKEVDETTNKKLVDDFLKELGTTNLKKN
jgi:F-type H+-transporting ATPase subunit b